MRRRARILQTVLDLINKPINEARILDLASLEGYYSFEFAALGADVVGIEGRRSNIEKAEARGRELHLPVQFVRDDVRNLNQDTYGAFDVVLALGILYHLDAPDQIPFLESIFETCKQFAVIDTHVGVAANSSFEHRDKTYHGFVYTEYEKEPSEDEQESSAWASIGNTKSFWLTRPSLINALADVGFTSVMEVHYPAQNDLTSDRICLIALKGEKRTPKIEPFDVSVMDEPVPEIPNPLHPIQQPQEQPTLPKRLKRRLARAISR